MFGRNAADHNGSTPKTHTVVSGIRLILRSFVTGFCRFAGTFLATSIAIYLAITLMPTFIQDTLGYNKVTALTETVVRESLDEIRELATYEFNYTNHVDCVDQPQLLGHHVALTDNWFAFDYYGTIKAGYTLDDMDIVWIDDMAKTVTIYLPEAEVLSNEIAVDMSTYEDRNNICNPLVPREIFDYLYAQKAPEQEKAISLGLKDLARDNAMRVITIVIRSLGYEALFKT